MPTTVEEFCLSTTLARGCELISQPLNPVYVREMPTEQFGAVPRRGTDLAGHIVRCFLEYCLLASLSYFILFVDL
eukprot:4908772-Karenia_brevis.AAC.1